MYELSLSYLNVFKNKCMWKYFTVYEQDILESTNAAD